VGRERLDLDYEECLRKGKIKSSSRGKSLVKKEIESDKAHEFLEESKKLIPAR